MWLVCILRVANIYLTGIRDIPKTHHKSPCLSFRGITATEKSYLRMRKISRRSAARNDKKGEAVHGVALSIVSG